MTQALACAFRAVLTLALVALVPVLAAPVPVVEPGGSLPPTTVLLAAAGALLATLAGTLFARPRSSERQRGRAWLGVAAAALRVVYGFAVGVVASLLGLLAAGAPPDERTSALAAMLAALAFAPLWACSGGFSAPLARLLAHCEWRTRNEVLAALGAYGALLGCLAASALVPMDWGWAWQRWPTPCTLGAVAGHAVATAVGVPAVLATSKSAAKVA